MTRRFFGLRFGRRFGRRFDRRFGRCVAPAPADRDGSRRRSRISAGGRDDQRGAASVEFVLLLPLLMLILALVVCGARVWWARTGVQQLAASAARQASISRSAADAEASASALVTDDARQTGLSCTDGPPELSLDTSDFGLPVGQPGTVRASVRCEVPLSDLLAPGLGGSITVAADASSTLDRYRGRG